MKLHFDKTRGIIVNEAGATVAFIHRVAHENEPDITHQMAAGPELLAACKRQHEAIDILFAMLIVATRDQKPPFYPSKSGEPWAATVAAHDLIKRLTEAPAQSPGNEPE